LKSSVEVLFNIDEKMTCHSYMNVFSNTDGLAHQKLERTNMDIACLFVCKWTCYDRLAINNFLVYNKKYVFVNTDRNTQVG